MGFSDKYLRHSRLVGSMADALGVDLDEKQMRAELAPEALDIAIHRCTGCDDPKGCQRWLNDQTEENIANAPPAYCRNTKFFELLS